MCDSRASYKHMQYIHAVIGMKLAPRLRIRFESLLWQASPTDETGSFLWRLSYHSAAEGPQLHKQHDWFMQAVKATPLDEQHAST